MMLTLALTLSAPFVLPSQSVPTPVITSNPYIHQMVCGRGRGTAVQINARRAISVAHVTSIGGCKINGTALTCSCPAVPAAGTEAVLSGVYGPSAVLSDAEHGILTQSWSPLGRGGALLAEPARYRLLLTGTPISQVMGADYEHMLRK